MLKVNVFVLFYRIALTLLKYLCYNVNEQTRNTGKKGELL